MAHIAVFVSLLKEYESTKAVALNGRALTIASIAAVGRRPDVGVVLDQAACKAGVEESRSWVEMAVAADKDIYGITTGFGACSDKRTTQVRELQEEFVRFLTVGLFGPDLGGAQPASTTRAAMAVRLNSLLLGFSGIRWSVLESLATLANRNILPKCPLRGSVTASGDLLQLCHMAGLLVGCPTVKAFILQPPHHEEELEEEGGRARPLEIPAGEALKLAGLQPVQLGAKEGIALANGTSFATAEASLVVYDAHLLFLLCEVCCALFCEVMFVRSEFADPVLHQVKNHRGQIEVAATMRWLLQGSQLIERGDQIYKRNALKRLKQDRYAVRSIPHWLGPQLEAIQQAVLPVENEANSVNDNPLIDAARDRALHGANFQGTAIGFSMDGLRVALAAIGKLIFAHFTELMLEVTNNGLTSNLAFGPDLALDFGFKGVDIAVASYLSELLHLAAPVTTHVQSAEQHNQEVNSLGLISARKTAEAIHLLKMMLASFLVAICQAADLRHLEESLHSVVLTTIKNVLQITKLQLQPQDQEGHATVLSSEILALVEHLNVLEYAHDPCNASLPFMSRLNTILLHHVEKGTLASHDVSSFKRTLREHLPPALAAARKIFLDATCSNSTTTTTCNGTASNGRKPTHYSNSNSAPYSNGKSTTSACNCNNIGTNKIRASKAYPLYKFVRKELNTEIATGALQRCRFLGEDVQKVFNAIHDGTIVSPLLKCFDGYVDTHQLAKASTNGRVP